VPRPDYPNYTNSQTCVNDALDRAISQPRTRLIAYTGDQPISTREEIVREDNQLDAAYRAGRIDATTLFKIKAAIPPPGSAAGVVIDDSRLGALRRRRRQAR
jgi:hypothetical protein